MIKITAQSLYNSMLLTTITIMYITLCAESDIFTPAFPQMLQYFRIAENQIQLIMSINFCGLFITSLIIGPLSDIYGRRKILLIGLFLLAVSSLGCIYAQDFLTMIIYRLLQGIASSVPMVIGVTLLFDKYSTKKASQLIGILNSIISSAIAGAPILGAWLSATFNWRANFIVIFTLAMISFLGALCIEETLAYEHRKKFNIITIAKDYIKLLKSFQFIVYSIIAVFPFISIVVYIANLSIIFINYLDMPLGKFGYYQASTMGTFIVVSALSTKLIEYWGINYTKTLGSILALIGALGIFYIGLVNHKAINVICVSMAFIASGGALMAGSFTSLAMEIFPDMKGTAAAMQTFIRQILACTLIMVSELFFNGTIVPVAAIIFLYAILSTIAYVIVSLRNKTT